MTNFDDVADAPLIVPYRHGFQAAFERLNRTWLEAHGLLEPADLAYLQDPQGSILAGGGQIYLALDGDAVVGTCAAIRVAPATIELAKLAVAPAAQQQGLGRQLCLRVIRFARDAGATRVELTSNSALVQAIRLYESLGFRHVPLPPQVRYRSADVCMTLHLPGPT